MLPFFPKDLVERWRKVPKRGGNLCLHCLFVILVFAPLWLHDGSKPAGGRIARVVRFLPCHPPHADGLGNSVHVQYVIGVEHS